MNHYLEKERIGKLMLKFSIPCIMALLVSSLYNIVDQIFIGQGIGYLGNGATNVVFPITIIALAIALMIGYGCAAFLSICQGRKNSDKAHISVGNAIIITIGIGLIVTILFFIFKEQLLSAFGATKNNIDYAREYYIYIVLGIPFFMFGNFMCSIIRADGNPRYSMMITLLGAIINIILDPLAIFVFGWGMKGAALATISGQIVTAILGFHYLRNAKSFHLEKRSFQLSISTIKSFLPLGMSSFLTQVSIVIIMIVMNNTLITFGTQSPYGADIPLTVMGIVMKVFQIVISIVVGIAAGSQPIIGYNYGAGRFDRVKEIFKTMMIAQFIVGFIAMILFEIFPNNIIQIFGSESALYNEFAVISFRIYLSTIILCCIQKSISIFLQSLGKPFLSTGLSLLKDFILGVPLVLFLPMKFGLTGILYSAPIADIISFLAAILCVLYTFKKMDSKEKQNSYILNYAK
ncbi:putative MATE family efflux protein [Breznakia sp. PF5-3]|uniref:MATE family efflux transporter n=1 Tax=unclassified Breznakia TaxID=2623764 RepID=UPI0024069326|nr:MULTISPECIES: MATE family efflux transporter [unclassified Breznakia]MDF9824337.1 putative MATE family efflux protein [Breznakia sp. PM6-1]MDF9835072.1 putative MATE family efflux protein [Breznakia sp. PF5-3]MDF9837757.1 putative MATE family efflux protein [Breznakia sp. PFB2-8]MDF9859636.1 putative MATE family efflux protein [Breznakia sp. PH5-24]